ncbi:hypothetical protein PROVALCAL_01548 [Providencia alcalifaciens DSM 30120]|uniref:Uncharacterized protein n=1 Tax=Providencia alcalifaciens DSM 30120 TaxID=520999 RepID=B6XDX3_9GAMM|nr:hypothetical protein PROVALCAL_01548 [Providencia alcalifaciens DSM 30120]
MVFYSNYLHIMDLYFVLFFGDYSDFEAKSCVQLITTQTQLA